MRTQLTMIQRLALTDVLLAYEWETDDREKLYSSADHFVRKRRANIETLKPLLQS